MTIFGLIFAAIALLMGIRLLTIAFQAAINSKVLVRQGINYRWQTVPSDQAWQRALRDGFMGLLFLVFAIVLMF
ncbi:MAG: hypothetical protein R3264_10245 [Anaerolineae bacterium]|nr:hypothetical protein [Anaerolineae bacterium]